MDLRDEGAGGVDDPQSAPRAVLAHIGRNSVRAVDDALAIGHLVFAIDEDGALTAKFFDHKTVVHDLFADVDRRPECFQGYPHYINRPDYAGAEATWLQ